MEECGIANHPYAKVATIFNRSAREPLFLVSFPPHALTQTRPTNISDFCSGGVHDYDTGAQMTSLAAALTWW